MPMTLEGSCQCGAVNFTVQSHTPVPYQRCYCSICRKQSGGGYAVNLGALADTLSVNNWEALGLYHAVHDDGEVSVAERYFCGVCGTPLWLYDERWPELVHPVASAITTALPMPPKRTHVFLDDKPEWVEIDAGAGDQTFAGGPDLSLEDWHKANGVWVE